jgi:ABC-type multidrug transport system permease subunit
MGEGDTLLNAVIGAVVTVLTSFVPVSPVVGGAVAGYLQQRDGPTVGALSGAIAAIPLLVVFGLLFAFVAFLGFGLAAELFAIGLFGLLAAFLLVLVISTLLGTVGGYLGVYIYEETDGELV